MCSRLFAPPLILLLVATAGCASPRPGTLAYDLQMRPLPADESARAQECSAIRDTIERKIDFYQKISYQYRSLYSTIVRVRTEADVSALMDRSQRIGCG